MNDPNDCRPHIRLHLSSIRFPSGRRGSRSCVGSYSNPCQHPVIILQDVHFSELESLLCFVYKGEVNIDQEHLPALLRAAETLQIRGLSGASDQVKEKRQRSAQPSHPSPPASPLALTPTSRPTRPRRPSSSSSVEPEYPPLKTELDDSRSNSRLSIGESMEDSREAVTTLNLSQKLEEADLGQSKGLWSLYPKPSNPTALFLYCPTLTP
ncbi:unnamed protein product [Timema podura]|uniref:BTB domain-containing protein n=1 Tax=Timema podura TaxID=61482 RepID=A0ABN7NQJ8_TIMPD|nr:unnamed protein product [Timema podura]